MITYSKQLVKGSLTILIGFIIAYAIEFFLRIILVRKLSIEEYGLFYTIFAFFLFLSIFQDFGLNSSIVKFIPEFRVKRRMKLVRLIIIYVLSFNTTVSTIIMTILFFISSFVVDLYFKNPLAFKIFPILIVYFWIESIVQSLRSIQLAVKNSFLFIFSVLGVKVIVLLSALVFIKNFSIETLSWSYLFASIILLFLYLFLTYKQFDLSKHPVFWSKDLFKKLIFYGMPLLFSSNGYAFIGYLDTLTLAYFSLKSAGIYNVIFPIALLLLIFGHAIGYIFSPISSEMWSLKLKKPLQNILLNLHKYLILLILPIGLIIVSFSDIFLSLFFGKQFIEGSNALQLLIIGILFSNLAMMNNVVLFGIGKSKSIFKVMITGMLLNIFLNLALIILFKKWLGILNCVALSTLISYIFLFVFSYVELSQFIELKSSFFIWNRIFLLSLIFLINSYIFRMVFHFNLFLGITVNILLSLSIYFFLVIKMKLFNLDEMKKLMKETIILR